MILDCPGGPKDIIIDVLIRERQKEILLQQSRRRCDN